MPRVQGYRARHYLNVYDSMPLIDDSAVGGWRFFGNRYIGDLRRTNLQIPGQLASDVSAVIFNVYARTNVCRVPVSKESLEIARDAFIEGRDDDGAKIILNEYRFEESELTRRFDEWAHGCVVTVLVGYAREFEMNLYDLFGGPIFGSGEDGEAKDKPTAHRRQLAQPIMFPVRQNFAVHIDYGVPDNLRRMLAEREIEPEPLLWIHLEGISVGSR